MNKSTLRRADLVMSIFLFLFAAFVFYQSALLMHRTLNLNNEDYAVWYRSAGLVPMVVSTLLGVSAIGLFFRAWRVGARFDFFTKEKVVGFFTSREFRVSAFIIGWLAVYIICFVRPSRESHEGLAIQHRCILDGYTIPALLYHDNGLSLYFYHGIQRH